MGPLDAIWHLTNFLLPALGVAALAAAAAKLVWRSALRGVRWARLAAWASVAGAAALIVGLLVFGRDGKMGSYGLLVLAEALCIWWVGLRPGKITRRQRR